MSQTTLIRRLNEIPGWTPADIVKTFKNTDTATALIRNINNSPTKIYTFHSTTTQVVTTYSFQRRKLIITATRTIEQPKEPMSKISVDIPVFAFRDKL